MNNFTSMDNVFSQVLNILPNGILWLVPTADENTTENSIDYKVRFINAIACQLLHVSEEAVRERFIIADKLIPDKTIERIILAPSTTSETYFSEQTQQWLSIDKRQIDAGYIIVIEDITQNKEQQQRIEKVVKKFQAAIDISQAGFFFTSPVKNQEGDIVDWIFNTVNQTVSAFANLTPEQLVGQLGSVWFPAYKTNGLFDRYVEVYTTGIPMRYELHYYEEGRLDVWTDFMITKYGDELLITLTDYTSLKQLQLQLEEYVQELKRSNESLAQFAYAASHDLQAPLRKISIKIDKLEQQYGDVLGDTGCAYVDSIKSVITRMRRLIQNMLVFAEVGSTQIRMEPVDLTQLVQEVVGDLEGVIEEYNGQVQVSELGTINGNSIHLEQLFQNLIGNALKYRKPHVPPLIKITSDIVSQLPNDLPGKNKFPHQQYLRIQVADNGQGFSNEQAKQVFKIFQRLPQHSSDTIGSGIGLAIVQRVVENHKGYIVAEGIPDVGATFSIYFPIE